MFRFISLLCVALFTTGSISAQQDQTYAEKLGWPKNAKVVILHVDDAGMSWSSNQGAIKSIENGVATSSSIMMTTPWAASYAKYAIAPPDGCRAASHAYLRMG